MVYYSLKNRITNCTLKVQRQKLSEIYAVLSYDKDRLLLFSSANVHTKLAGHNMSCSVECQLLTFILNDGKLGENKWIHRFFCDSVW